MAEVTLKNFLNNDPRVKAARKKLTAAGAELNKQKNALATGGSRINQAQRDIIQRRIDAAQEAYNKANKDAQEAETSRTQFFNINKKNIQAEATGKEVTQAKEELQELLITKQSQPNNPILDARIANLNDQINQRGKYAPKTEKIPEGAVVGDQSVGTGTATVDYNQLINSSVSYIRKLSGPDRRQLSEDLKAAGFYKGPAVDIYTDDLVSAYQTALQANQARSLAFGENVPWGQFLADRAMEIQALGGGAGGPRVTGSVSFSTPQEARTRVEKIFESELGRLPTTEETDKLVNDLLAREKKSSAVQKATTKKVGGVSITEYTGGFDRDQFLVEKIRKLPEYSQRKSENRSLTVQSLQGVANRNGITLSPQQLQEYALEVQNGKDIKVIQNQIRNLAGLGMPDTVKKMLAEGTDLETIYSPYKRIMASVLELNPDTISLNDPTLRSAIGSGYSNVTAQPGMGGVSRGEYTMSLYDFQRQLRKDPRWQYTNNAREEVSTAALQVLRDFGFQG